MHRTCKAREHDLQKCAGGLAHDLLPAAFGRLTVLRLLCHRYVDWRLQEGWLAAIAPAAQQLRKLVRLWIHSHHVSTQGARSGLGFSWHSIRVLRVWMRAKAMAAAGPEVEMNMIAMAITVVPSLPLAVSFWWYVGCK